MRIHALLEEAEEYSGPLLPFIREWAAALLQAYRQQIIAAFDKYGSLVQGGVVLFCFALAPQRRVCVPSAPGDVPHAFPAAAGAGSEYAALAGHAA